MLGPEAGTCVISVGTNLEGKFNSKENVRLDGKIVGEVFCESRLVMGDTGVVHGSIHAAEAVIMGKIEGDIHIRGSLTLKNTARIKGNISAKLMAVEEGAQYNGECKIGAEPSGK
jgi:cytoskeletal protein CcmA (bactofilin family)